MPKRTNTKEQSAKTPKLLAGGNPQIAKGDGEGPVNEYINATPGWKQDIVRQLDSVVTRLVPDVRKAVRWNSPFYGIEGQGWFLSYHCMTRYVKVTFLNGSQLDPPPPIESKHEAVRYLHLSEDEPADLKQLESWITQAAKLPGDHLF